MRVADPKRGKSDVWLLFYLWLDEKAVRAFFKQTALCGRAKPICTDWLQKSLEKRS